MSTIEEKTVFCAMCGRQSAQRRLMSFSTFAGPDLDYRPAQLLRSTIKYWVMVCPHCGYVAKEISKRPRVSRNALERLYTDADKELPKLAHLFQKRALHCEYIKDMRGAIRAYLCAAWVCDDREDEAKAGEMREKCLELTKRGMQHCRSRDWNRYMVLMADLLRRTGALEELFAIDAFDKRMSDTTKKVIGCQQALARKNDFAAHCCDEFDLELE